MMATVVVFDVVTAVAAAGVAVHAAAGVEVEVGSIHTGFGK